MKVEDKNCSVDAVKALVQCEAGCHSVEHELPCAVNTLDTVFAIIQGMPLPHFSISSIDLHHPARNLLAKECLLV